MTTVKEELQNADYPEIRFFRVEHQLAPDAPADDCSGVWEVCTPATLPVFRPSDLFSAARYITRYTVP